ncbi:hypothetical protein PUN28_014015 [Cardiocondyla obscurior]|uniref:Uncharacterized protein n=1 Tax=Cardiocondyla obscurior TaxID=286306 RepID=A0AAW2F5L7_9HYME
MLEERLVNKRLLINPCFDALSTFPALQPNSPWSLHKILQELLQLAAERHSQCTFCWKKHYILAYPQFARMKPKSQKSSCKDLAERATDAQSTQPENTVQSILPLPRASYQSGGSVSDEEIQAFFNEIGNSSAKGSEEKIVKNQL